MTPAGRRDWLGFLCRKSVLSEFVFGDCYQWIAKRKQKSSAMMLTAYFGSDVNCNR